MDCIFYDLNKPVHKPMVGHFLGAEIITIDKCNYSKFRLEKWNSTNNYFVVIIVCSTCSSNCTLKSEANESVLHNFYNFGIHVRDCLQTALQSAIKDIRITKIRVDFNNRNKPLYF